ncbi:Probable RNA-directed DNA polymerase from transposon BS [Eumeta japonica]|uniref:Probable RNA-directed DNA polymerase from transposon BS n=1 Tax=Eumeta variegata TaxID=151549 RepID=A0A4C1VA21_EUMVA|nr:Probable RNA-directed DNA polymerase from transposon BS [Eumeta japonica]
MRLKQRGIPIKGKAPGHGGISNKAIKCFSLPLLSLLVAIFNACLKNCYFPPAWKEAEIIGTHKLRKTSDLPASYRPISFLSGLDNFLEKTLKTRLSDHLLGKGLIINKQFSFRPAHSCLQQVLRLVEYERTHSTRRLIRVGVPEGSALSPLLYSAYTNDIPRPLSGVQLALFADDIVLFFKSRTMMTYTSLVFAHANPKALNRLQVEHNKFCRTATDTYWCVRNTILHRDLELPTVSKYMKDASKRFFDIAGSHVNALLRAAVDYEPPHSSYFIRRPRNVLIDPPDVLTAAVESLNDVNDTHD